MISKTSLAIQHLNARRNAKALSIFTTFKLGFTAEEKETLRVAHEVNTGKATFYQQLGINTAKKSLEAVEIMKTYSQKYR